MHKFVIVSGLPVSGKTTLARVLAKQLNVEHLDKDEYLEELFMDCQVASLEQRKSLSRLADEKLKRHALQRRAAILSSWWRHLMSPGDSGTPVDWFCDPVVEFVEVHCSCPAATSVARFLARKRHPGHLDGMRSEPDLLRQFVDAERLGPLFPNSALICDTQSAASASVVASLAKQVRRLGRIDRQT